MFPSANNLNPHCLVLIGSRNGLKSDFTIDLKTIDGIMED